VARASERFNAPRDRGRASARMVKVRVHHDRLTRYSSIGMMLLGLFTLIFVSGFFGIILIVIGYVMYRYYRRQSLRALEGSGPRV